MPPTIRLSSKAKRLLDHTDTDIVDRYMEYLTEEPDRHIWLGPKLLIDVDQVIRRRFACNTHLCLKQSRAKSNGKIKAKTKYSCCWDLEVQLLPTEIEAIERQIDLVLPHHPDVARHVRKHGFWKYDSEWWKIFQKKKNGSCAFLTWSEEMGMHVCSLHATALREGFPLERIKPLICRMFPLFLLETDDINIITFYCEETHRILFEDDYERMNCLHENEHAVDRVYIAMADTLRSLVGANGYEKLEREADRILASG
jgi:Protein of unknown function (DUF3109)